MSTDNQCAIIDKLMKKLSETEVSKEALSGEPLGQTRQRISVQGRVPRSNRSSRAPDEAAKRRAMVEQSKSRLLIGFSDLLNIGGQYETSSSSFMSPPPKRNKKPKAIPSYIEHLCKTRAGQTLLDLHCEDWDLSNKVLYMLMNSASNLEASFRFNRDTMIRNPVGAFLDFQDEFRARANEKGSIFALTQKQSRILDRIGYTVDISFNRPPNGGTNYHNELEIFKALWVAHMEALESAASDGVSNTAPVLTFVMLELLTATCDPQWVRSKCPNAGDFHVKVQRQYPLKKIINKLTRKSRALSPQTVSEE
jgi:hypothetical protein